MKERGLSESKIEVNENWFSIIFKRKKQANALENVPENVPEKRVGLICQLIKEDNAITALELAKRMGVSDKTIKRDLKKLKKEGKIRRVGSARGGHWEVV